jgi:hypothetical protein
MSLLLWLPRRSRDSEIAGVELAIALQRVMQTERTCLNGETSTLVSRPELRHGETTVQENHGRMIFKMAVRSPLHANELRCENGEARVTRHNDSSRLCCGRVGGLRGLLQ